MMALSGVRPTARIHPSFGFAHRLVLCILLVWCGACGFPRDPEHTLDRVRGGTMRVGVVESDPWVKPGGAEPSGVEAELVRRFAREIGVQSVEWVRGGGEELMEMLLLREIDLVIGGFTLKSPYSKEVGFTSAYFTAEILVGVPPGVAPPEDLTGVRIAVEPPALAAAYLSSEDAVPVRVPELAGVNGLVAAPDWKLEALGFARTEHTLYAEQHAMAVVPGENDFLVRLEQFLLARKPLVRQLLMQEAGT